MKMSVDSIETLNEISTFLLKKTNSLWRTFTYWKEEEDVIVDSEGNRISSVSLH